MSSTRKKLVISDNDDAELEQLCKEYNDAEKQWLGGIFLRYGMRHAGEAVQLLTDESAEATRQRRLAALIPRQSKVIELGSHDRKMKAD